MTKREGAGAPEPARFDPVPGAVVAEKYRVERVLGEGGMGLVVAATHLGLDQAVAIKFLLPEAMRNKVAVERFLREARVAAKVKSEHVARVHDVGTLDDGVPYIVMEHLVGADLGRLIADGGALPVDEACEVTLQACEALAEVHAAGIVHRDLKPSNLFVTRRADGSPSVKLLDFGISKLTFGAEDTSVDPALTATTTIMGSPSYMSPEQLKSTKEVDPRADVWSLGTVLYEALTGKPAFRGETVPQVCAMIASEEPVLPSAVRDGIPLELERAVLGCLEKDANKRMTLVDLAHVLAHHAPERAKPSLERIEAVLGTPPRSKIDLWPVPRGPLPAVPLVTSERNRTVSSWGRREKGDKGDKEKSAQPGRKGPGRTLLLLVGILGVLAAALYTGQLSVRKLKGDIAGATSAVASAASAVSSVVATSFPEIPIPSALPVPTLGEPEAADADTDEEEEEEEDAAVAEAGAPHRASHGGQPKKHVPRKHAPARRHHHP